MERKIAFFLVEYAPPTVEVKKPACGKVVFWGAIRPVGPSDSRENLLAGIIISIRPVGWDELAFSFVAPGNWLRFISVLHKT
ncbi:MAG: hypothetical protein ACKN94_01330 [Pirellulaceae bacterium]